eukprot:scaffold203085_cov30-Tisochrysis_lutea.AAC.3
MASLHGVADRQLHRRPQIRNQCGAHALCDVAREVPYELTFTVRRAPSLGEHAVHDGRRAVSVVSTLT